MDSHDINPFIPIQPTKKGFFTSFITFFFAFLKFPLFLISLSLSFVYTLIASIIPIVIIKQIILKITSKIFIRILLYVSGLFSINQQPTPLVDTYSAPQEVNIPKAGDIIISNLASYLNILWFQFQYTPIFVIPCDETNVYVFGVFNLIIKILTCQPLKSTHKKTLSQVEASARKIGIPIVIFPECSVTNGEYIINFNEFGKGFDTNGVDFFIYGFIHFDYIVSPNFTYGNGFLHILQMLGRPFSGMKIKIALPQDIPKIELNSIDATWISKCRKVLSTIMGIRALNVDGSEFDRLYSWKIKRKKKDD